MTYQTIGVGDEEDPNEDSNPVTSRDLLAQGFDARDTRRFSANEWLGWAFLILFWDLGILALVGRAILRHVPRLWINLPRTGSKWTRCRVGGHAYYM